MIRKHVDKLPAYQVIHLRILSVEHTQQPFFEKSAVDDASAEWTGVDNNQHWWSLIWRQNAK